MKVLIVAAYNTGKFSPFVVEQVDSLRKSGITIEYFGIVGKGARGYLCNRKRLITKIKEFQPDIIHAHYGLSGLLANFQRKVPVITTFHGSDIHTGGILLCLSKLCMSLSTFNIFVSPRLFEKANYKKSNFTIQPCGINTETFYPIPKEKARKLLEFKENGKYILFAGAFNNQVKNADLAKEAVSLMKESQLIELKGFSREKVNLLMNACDCLLMTSYREASPMVIKEAMLCGCPIVSVNVGDVKDVIGNTEGCFVCTTYEPDEVAENITKALNFEGKTRGRDRIMELELDNRIVAKKVKDIYDRV